MTDTTTNDNIVKRVRVPLTGDALKLDSALTLAIALTGHGSRENLAKAAGISPLTLSASVKRGVIYKGIADALVPHLKVGEQTLNDITDVIKDESAYCLIKSFVRAAPERASLNREAIERTASVKAVFAAIVKLNKYQSVKDFADTNNEFDVSWLASGHITNEIIAALETLPTKGGKKPFSTYGALDEYVIEDADSDESEESEETL